jgi:hypothetical protein
MIVGLCSNTNDQIENYFTALVTIASLSPVIIPV